MALVCVAVLTLSHRHRGCFSVRNVSVIPTTDNNQTSSRLFGRLGYRVALISRRPEHLNKVTNEINQNGGEVSRLASCQTSRPDIWFCYQAAAFPVAEYTPNSIRSAFSSIRSHFPVSTSPLRVAVFNAGYGIWKPFLEITDEEVRESLDTHVVAAFAFSREVLLEFTKNDPETASEGGKGGSSKRGTLIFTGATAAIRGNITTSAFAAGKFGVRALSQSLAKEFGKQNIHVCGLISCVIVRLVLTFRGGLAGHTCEFFFRFGASRALC
jgi:NAD(P)-dependent dehydrogenase (short-subunit alcohol dehydrogenase family)